MSGDYGVTSLNLPTSPIMQMLNWTPQAIPTETISVRSGNVWRMFGHVTNLNTAPLKDI